MPNAVRLGRLSWGRRNGGTKPESTVSGEQPVFLPQEPLLSIVVPMYQVEAYLAECLDSLLAQEYSNLEIVLVDDGSTDAGPEIAARYAERDDRIRILRQDNRGLGAARNTGLAHCTGDLVAFADSDDTVPPGAYLRMVRTLQASGSDFVVGAIVRDEGGTDTMRPWVRRAHARRRLGVTIDDVPDLLINVVACTKVFRRDFLQRMDFRFPEAIRYEDQVPVTRAYLEARAFDVLHLVVYRWRKRDDKSSLSQRKAEMQDLLDRLSAQREVAELLERRASPAVLRQWYVKTFRLDFFTYLKVAANADAGYWEKLREGLEWLAVRMPEDVRMDLELRVRLAAWLGRQGHRDALRRFIRHPGFDGSNFPVERRGDHLYVDPVCLEDVLRGIDLPDALLRIERIDLRLRPHLRSLDWSAPGRLRVRCTAAVDFVDPRSEDVAVSVLVVDGDGRSALPPVRARAEEDQEANLVAGRPHEDHTRSTVVADLDLSALVRASIGEPTRTWHIEVEVSALGHSVQAPLSNRTEHGSAAAVRAVLVDGALVVATWSERAGLLLQVSTCYAAVSRVEPAGDGFEMDVHAPDVPDLSRMLVGGRTVAATVSDADSSGVRTVRFPRVDESGQTLSGRVRVAGAESRPRQLTVVAPLDPLCVHAPGVDLRSTPESLLLAARDEPTVLVDDVRIEAQAIVLRGRARGVPARHLWLQSRRSATMPVPLETQGDQFTIRVPTCVEGWSGDFTEPPVGSYRITLDDGPAVRIRAGRLYDEPAPRPARNGWSVEVDFERRLLFRRFVHADRSVASRHGQTALRATTYRRALSGPRSDLVVFECFGGTGVGDSPRAVSDLLADSGHALDLVWSVADRSVTAPPGARAVVRESQEWYAAMGAARLIVSNNTLPRYLQKGIGQTYLQTWHGTPLKRIGTDLANTRVSTEHYLRRLMNDVQHWDVLVSPSAYCTGIFRRAFGYDGRVLEIGRPSNDLLLGARAGLERQEVRARLGIPEGQTVLLYAPTWREDLRTGTGSGKVLHLDHDRVTAHRPDVTVLLRGHPNSARQPTVTGNERVVDVTTYPDIARLYLAADVLVTDYSAAMFDFCLTDRPIILLAPDLETYRDHVRGLYFDLHAIAPGPVVRTTDELLDVLEDADRPERREAMRSQFAPLDDGKAAGRLVEAVLGDV